MAIVRLQHIGTVVRDFADTWSRFDRILGMTPRDFRDDQSRGFQHDARVLLGNDCWIHFVHNWNPATRVYRFLEDHGERLEHIAIETNSIEADVEHLRKMGVPLFQDKIFDANDGYEAFVYPDDAVGFTVELIQHHDRAWVYPENARGTPVSNKLGVHRADHLTARVADVDEAAKRMEKLFKLKAENGRISLGNNCALELVQDTSSEPRNRGLERLVLETKSLDEDLSYLKKAGVPVSDGCILGADGVGFAVELRESAKGR
jgi:4-hydroxyphenylpyruvate dioxygenase-like putative hemolysin